MFGRYAEYIQVDEDFIPVFDEGWDKKYPKRWKSFYPHHDFLSILESVVATLEGTRNEDRKSLWVYGAYGTGKTFASFVIQHLLEDPLEDVEDYFQVYKLNRSLLNRLIGLRKQKTILVARRSASSGITQDYLLFEALQSSIIESIKRHHFTYLGTQSLYQEVVWHLSDPDSPFDFPKVFRRARNKYFPEYSSPEAVIRDLKERNPEQNSDLLSRVVEFLREERQSIVPDDPQKICIWIADVIQRNGIHAMLFIWDEFSDYFRQNRAFTGLQEIAQAVSSAPFYLFLITHKDYEQFLKDEQDRRRIMDRFKTHHIYMSEPTALQLMANVIQVKPEKEDEWQKVSEALWNAVKPGIRRLFEILENDSMRWEHLRKLLPVHPYSAFLLSILSRFLSSNQRTMFQFLSGKGEKSPYNFQCFIEEYGISARKLLTCDVLWDYFFAQDNVEIPDSIRWIVNRLSNVKEKAQNDEELRVLKAVFLLCAVQRIFAARSISSGLPSALLVPTLSNLSLAFAGTEIEDKLRSILERLVKERILWTRREGEDVQYILQEDITDPERYNEILEQIRREMPLERIMENEKVEGWIQEKLSPVYLRDRFQPLKCASRRNWKNVLKEPSSGRVPCVIIVTTRTSEGNELEEEVSRYLDNVSFECVAISASSEPFGEDNLEEYWKKEADVRYFEQIGGRNENIKLYEEQRQNVVKAWLNRLQNAVFLVRYRIQDRNTPSRWVTRSRRVEGLEELRKELELIDKSIFYWGLETIAEHESLFKSKSFSKEIVKIGTGVSKASGRYNYFSDLRSKLESMGVWNEERYWEKDYREERAQAIVAMKREVERVITTSLQEKREVTIRDIYEALQQKPFGLLEWAGTLFLLGFLLRDYCKGRYYRYDGKSAVPINDDTLADMVFNAVRKDEDSVRIVEMTKEQELFCLCSVRIFPFDQERQKYSIKGIQNAIRDYLSRVRYPLWSVRFTGNLKEDEDKVQEIIDSFCSFVACRYQTGSEDESYTQPVQEIALAEEIARKIADFDPLVSFAGIDYLVRGGEITSPSVAKLLEELRQLFQPDSLKKGLQEYLRTQWPQLLDLARRVNFDDEAILRVIKRRTSEDAAWLWEKEDFDRKVEQVQEDLNLLALLRQYFSEAVREEDTIGTYLRRVFATVKVSHAYIREESPCPQLVEQILQVCQDQDLSLEINNKRAFFEALVMHGETLAQFFTKEGFAQVIRKHSEEILSISPGEEELFELYEKLPSGQFLCSKEEFVNTVRHTWEEYQASNKLNILKRTWQKQSGTNSPREWSKKCGIPVFWVLGEEPLVQDTCEALEGKRRLDAHALEKANHFLETSDKTGYLGDLTKCNELFIRRLFPGQEQILLLLMDHVEELKAYIRDKVAEEPYEWYRLAQEVQRIAREYWSELYKSYYADKARKRVETMDALEAKQWLEKMVCGDPWIGMAILTENAQREWKNLKNF